MPSGTGSHAFLSTNILSFLEKEKIHFTELKKFEISVDKSLKGIH
jgi:hypothetical protein